MAELSVKCPTCGMPLKAPTEDELVKAWQEHSKTAHSMELSEEEARAKVKMAMEAGE